MTATIPIPIQVTTAMGNLRAAVIGASGIGKHHAKWLHNLGCTVTAFAGTSPESVVATGRNLRDLFGFKGVGYASVEEMLAADSYDVISICSPQELHYDHFMASVETGAHIMCEKPLVYDASLPVAEMLAQGEAMVAAVDSAGIVAGINTQYFSAAAAYRDLMKQRGASVDEPTGFFMQMDSRGGDEGADFESIWVDLGPHPLSVLVAFCGPGEMIEAGASCTVSRKRVEAEFDYQPTDGPLCSARIVCCNRPEGDLVRRLGINDVLVDYEGRNDEQGVYRAYLTCEGDEVAAQDFVEASIERFLMAVRGEAPAPLADVAGGLANLRMQLHIAGMAERI
jgi:predicted dehydrogenase